MNNLETASSKPCQYYRYSNRESVVTEVSKYFFQININNLQKKIPIIFYFTKQSIKCFSGI